MLSLWLNNYYYHDYDYDMMMYDVCAFLSVFWCRVRRALLVQMMLCVVWLSQWNCVHVYSVCFVWLLLYLCLICSISFAKLWPWNVEVHSQNTYKYMPTCCQGRTYKLKVSQWGRGCFETEWTVPPSEQINHTTELINRTLVDLIAYPPGTIMKSITVCALGGYGVPLITKPWG